MGLLICISALLTLIVLVIPEPPSEPVSASSGADAPGARGEHRERTVSPTAPLAPSAPAIEPSPGSGLLAIVIDDVGNNLGELEPFLPLPGPLTFAVLPHLPQSGQAAALVRAAGHDVILHAPMEATDGRWPGPGVITVEHELLDVWGQLAESFDSIDGAPGANNHMGSRLTADPVAMDAVMAYLGATGRFFLDSRTTPSTVAQQFAQAHGVPFLRRDVFLDNVRQADAIAAAFDEGVSLAASGGRATVIGHAASVELAAYLARRLPTLAVEGVRLVGVASLALAEVARAEGAWAGAEPG